MVPGGSFDRGAICYGVKQVVAACSLSNPKDAAYWMVGFNVIPSIYNDPNLGHFFRHDVTSLEEAQGWLELPALRFRAAGYKEAELPGRRVMLNSEDFSRGILTTPAYIDGRQRLYHLHFVRPDVHLEEDLQSPVWRNTVELTVNSEPQGARIYQESRYVGTAPLKLNYLLEPANYGTKMPIKPLIAVREGCLPQQQNLELDIPLEWHNPMAVHYELATLFLLQTDPDYKPPPQVIVQQPPQVVVPQPPEVVVTQPPPADDQPTIDLGIILKKITVINKTVGSKRKY
jgi:hypothetical protein